MNKINKLRLYFFLFMIFSFLFYVYLVNWDTDYYRHDKFMFTAIFGVFCSGAALISTYFLEPRDEYKSDE